MVRHRGFNRATTIHFQPHLQNGPDDQRAARANAAATPPTAQRAFPVIIGIAALPDSVWLVAAALLLSEDSLVLVPVLVPPVVDAEVVKVALLVEAAVEADTEAPVVAAAFSVPVPVIVTVIKPPPPGISVRATAEVKVVVMPSSSRLAAQVTLTESYLQFSVMDLFQEMISYDLWGRSGFFVELDILTYVPCRMPA